MLGALRRLVSLCVLLVSAGLIAACGSDGTGTGSRPPGTPQVVNPRSVGGGPGGQGPLIVTHPTSPISLPDRVLTVVSAKDIYSKARKTTLIDLTLTITNPGSTPINNQPQFFALIASGGDIFDHQDNSSDTFYAPIAPGTSRTGFIEFQIPSPKATGFQLFYRPDVSADELIATLIFS